MVTLLWSGGLMLGQIWDRETANHRRAFRDRLVPAFQVRMSVEGQAELWKSVDPRPVGDVGNTVIAYEIVAVAQSFIEHAEKTHGLALVALDGERNLLGREDFEVPELTHHWTNMPNLEEQPLQCLYLLIGSCPIEAPALLREIEKDGSGFE